LYFPDPHGLVDVPPSREMDALTPQMMGGMRGAGVAGLAVVATDGVNENVILSSRNIPGVVTTPADILNVYDIVNAKSLVVDKAALATIEEVYA
ncbi:MAG: 50S ribosomal protein L4, partial [Clostridiales bacterium]|nr:50S ribosomal protein L4 [Clostridiales bacterium]